MKLWTLILTALIFCGCGLSESKSSLKFTQSGITTLDTLPPSSTLSYAEIHSAIIKPQCLRCHSIDGGDEGGINLETFENLTASLDLVRAEVLSDSMPLGASKLSANQKEIFLKWIDAGGPLNAPVKPEVEFISYEMVNTKVIQPRCLNCHSNAGGNRGDVNLETYEKVVELASTIEVEITNGSMPRPRNKPLTQEQKDLILKWIANGTPKT